MRKVSFFVAAAVICMVVGGCKRDHEKALKDSMDCMNELANVLKNVKDEASAKAAAPKIQAIADRMNKLKEEVEKLPKLSESDEKRLKEKYETQVKQAQTALMGEVMRIVMDPKLGPAREVLTKMNSLK